MQKNIKSSNDIQMRKLKSFWG